MGKEADPKQGRGAGRRGEGTRARPCPTPHPPTAVKPPIRRTCGPSACHIPVRFTHNSPTNTRPNSPPYHCPASPLTRGPPPFPPTSHCQIDGCCQAAHPTLDGRRQTAHPTLDGRRQAAHPTREESVMAGSMQVPPMAMCGIDGIEHPHTPLPIGACICFGFEYSNPKQMHVLFEGVQGGRTKPHQLHSLGKTLPRAGRTGYVLDACSHRAPGKTIPE